MDEKVIIVSADSHAGIPKELWPEYLAEEFHELLPSLRQDNVIYPTAMALLGAKIGVATHPEHKEAHTTGWHGLHDPVLRLADMDREGIVAELIYLGDNRLGDLFHNVMGRKYSLEAWEAGARGWNRWASDNFGFAMDRFLVTGAIGPCVDMDRTVEEIEWLADHDFTGTYGPTFMHHPGMPPLFDPYWEPFWSACEDTGIAIVVHAGYGTEQGVIFPQVERIYNDVAQAAGTTDYEALFAHTQVISEESMRFFDDFLNRATEARRSLWQLMLGGVFDRHPRLKYLATESAWTRIPATLEFLDKVYDEDRGELPARRKPSEYWHSNCLGGASFIHRAEVEMRDEIGIETICFGRDFPHPEGTWPHTREWLRDAFVGVPDHDLRLILGENAVRFLELDRSRLAEIAKRIGLSPEEIHAGGDVRADLIENFDVRGGYLKPFEGGAKLPDLEGLLRADLSVLATTH